MKSLLFSKLKVSTVKLNIDTEETLQHIQSLSDYISLEKIIEKEAKKNFPSKKRIYKLPYLNWSLTDMFSSANMDLLKQKNLFVSIKVKK